MVSRKYGQTPFHQEKNPGRLSITELEFNEAMRLKLPILLFIMGEKHPVTEADIELDPDKREKLAAFRERAKRTNDGSEVERVFAEFDSLQDFAVKAANAIGGLARDLGPNDDDDTEKMTSAPETGAALPLPPALAALPRYLGSHPFVGRASELQTLSDWCGAADPNPMLLFEAMGGSGKSMLTWEWVTNHATIARGDWAGRFWYSFDEKGAVMATFCRHALAYMAMKRVEEFAKLRTPELSDLLVAELEKGSWLLVLDGLERVLVAYHRLDAAQLQDDEVDVTADQIGERDPRMAVRPEDDELLRRLAAIAQSKILVSSRLTPLALVNRSGMPVPGVRREILPGLRPADAEDMIRACGVSGRSNAIQAYLQTNCDCHPLVIGALAGLINDYPPDRGNFDRWADDFRYGGALNLAELNLVQRRNHILRAAIEALAPENRQLLQTLALLQGGADFMTLEALNPPPVGEDSELWNTIFNLEKRGLLQYDHNDKRYDLHPVVRGVAVGRMGGEETQELGQRVVDYFTRQPHDPWEKAEKLEDVARGVQIVRVLLLMGRHTEALRNYQGDLANALGFNLNANAEMQALLRPFFPEGWDGESVPLDGNELSYLLNDAALSLAPKYPNQGRKLLERKLALDIRESQPFSLGVGLRNLAQIFVRANRLAETARFRSLWFEIAEATENDQQVFGSKLGLFALAVACGDLMTADDLWRQLDGMGRDWNRAAYRPGEAEKLRAEDLFYRGELTEEILRRAEILAREGRNRGTTKSLHELRGEWHLINDEPIFAIKSLMDSVRMAREIGEQDAASEALLALARLRAGERIDVLEETEKFSKTEGSAAIFVAELWRELGNHDNAVEHALRAHRWAVADGEPYVHRYYLDRAQALLTELGAKVPEVRRYDPSKATPFPWETDVRAFIEKLKAEKKKTARKFFKGSKRKGPRQTKGSGDPSV